MGTLRDVYFLVLCIFLVIRHGYTSSGDRDRDRINGSYDLQLLKEISVLEVSVEKVLKFAIAGPMIFIISAGDGGKSEIYSVNTTVSYDPGRVAELDSRENIVEIAATTIQNQINIIAIGYEGSIQIAQVSRSGGNSSSLHLKYLQKLSINNGGRLRQMIMFRTNFENAQRPILYMIVLSTESQQDHLRMYQWIDSGFHQTDQQHHDRIDKMFVLTQKGCQCNLIMITQTNGNDKIKNSILLYQTNRNGKLEFKQNLQISYEIFAPFMWNVENYHFLVCNHNICTIYQSPIEFLEFVAESDDKIIDHQLPLKDFFYDQDIGIMWSSSENQKFEMYTFRNSNLNSLIRLNYTSQMNGERGLIDMKLRRIGMDYNSSEMVELYTISKDSRSIVFSVARMNLTESSLINASVDPIENIIQKIQSRIYARKLFLDRIATLANQRNGAIDSLKLNKTIIDNGTIRTLNLNNSVLSFPHTIKRKLRRLTTKLMESVASKPKKHIYIKQLHLNNLIYNGTLFFDTRKHKSMELVAKNNVTSKEIHTRRLIELKKSKSTSLQQQQQQLPSPQLKLFQNIKVDNLIVDRINTTKFSQLYSEAFLRTRDRIINGSLIYRDSGRSFRCKQLTAKILNQRKLNDFFTLTTNQTIDSDIFVTKFLVTNLVVDSFNAMDLNGIAMTGMDNRITSPLQIDNFTISGDLTLSGTINGTSYFTEHFRRTSKTNSFSQIYNGAVYIKGQLTVNNIYTTSRLQDRKQSPFSNDSSHSKTQLILHDLDKLFWMKSVAQTFNETIRFSMPVYLYQLNSTSINDQLLDNYQFRFGSWKLPSRLNIKTVTINGSLSVDLQFPDSTNKQSIQIEQLNANLIYRNAINAEIFERKQFLSKLRVVNFETDLIHSKSVADMVRNSLKETPFSISRKSFRILTVRNGLVVKDTITIDRYNSRDISKLFETVILFDRNDRNLNILKDLRFLNGVQIDDIKTDRINGLSVSNEVFELIQKRTSNKQQKSMVIRGNFNFNANLKIEKINNINWNNYVSMVKLNNNKMIPVGGKKYFTDHVLIRSNLNVQTINDVNLERLYKMSLKRTGTQTINKSWKFENIQIQRFLTSSKIDGVNSSHLIRSDQNHVRINGGLKFTSFRLRNNLFGEIDRNSTIVDSMIRLQHINNTNWRQVRVRSHTEWPDTPSSTVNHIYNRLKNHVIRSGSAQTISGTVRFKIPPKFDNLLSKYHFAGVDFFRIANDYLSRDDSTLQSLGAVVNGSKYFESPLLLNANIQMLELNVETINNIDVIVLNQTFYRRNSHEFQLISNRKLFTKSPTIENLIVEGSVNGVMLNRLIVVDPTSTTHASTIQFFNSNISIETLNVTRLNHIDFTEFVKGRVRLTGDRQTIHGCFKLDKLRTKHAILPSINGILLDRVLLKKFHEIQVVSSSKHLVESLQIIGPLEIVKMNGIQMNVTYKNSMFLDHHYKFKRIELIGNGTTIFSTGINIFQDINGDLAAEIHASNKKLKRLISDDTTVQMKNLFKKSTKMLYMEYGGGGKNSNVSLKNAQDQIESDRMLPVVGLTQICNDCMENCKEASIRNFQTFTENQLESITIRNNCPNETSKLEIDLNPNMKILKNFPQNIENVWKLNWTSNNHSSTLFLVEFKNPANHNKSLALFEMDQFKQSFRVIHEFKNNNMNNINNNFHSNISSKLYKFNNRTLLLTTTSNQLYIIEVNSNSSNPFIILSSRDVIRWNYANLVPTLDEQSIYQLIVAKRGDRFITIYSGNLTRAFQTIQIQRPLEHFASFHDTKLNRNVLIVFTRDNFFYMYVYYTNVEGWIYEAYGVNSDLNVNHVHDTGDEEVLLVDASATAAGATTVDQNQPIVTVLHTQKGYS